ncbi:MAG: JAB domain-containing protein, partial [Verrucomicrobia bacterium]|nr:JAB domain-containing protein [Verrucomicrobiota bacterium]
MPTPEDRPRERLVRLGPRALLDAELLELLIGAGTKGAP